MNGEQQLILNFDHRVALTGEDFLVSSCNREAIEWIDRWPDWPSSTLVIVGPSGSGKSHLSAVFAVKSGARLLVPDEFETAAAAIRSDVIVEDVEGLLDTTYEEPLLHLYNSAKEAGFRMLLTAQTAPARWGVKLPDLRSRLNAALTVEIGPPEDTLIAALLVKMFRDRQVQVSDDVIAYAVSRMERSFYAARELVRAADTLALREGKGVTVPLMKRVLERLEEHDGE